MTAHERRLFAEVRPVTGDPGLSTCPAPPPFALEPVDAALPDAEAARSEEAVRCQRALPELNRRHAAIGGEFHGRPYDRSSHKTRTSYLHHPRARVLT